MVKDTTISLNHGSKWKSLLRGSLAVGKCLPGRILVEKFGGCRGRRRADGYVVHFDIHSTNVRIVGFFHPFSGSLLNLILHLPMCLLRLAPCRDLVHLSSDEAHYEALSAIICRTLGSVMSRLITLEASD